MAKVEISKRLVLINSASSLAAHMVNATVLIWLQQYLLKRISVQEYALYPVLASVMAFLPLLTLTLTSGLGRYIVEAYARGDERRVTQIVSTMFPLTLGVGLAILVGGAVLAWHVDSVLTISPERLWDARIMMGLMVFSFSFTVILSPFAAGFVVRQKLMLLNGLTLAKQGVRITLLFVLLLLLGAKVMWVVVASVSAEVCAVIVNRMISCRLVPAIRFRYSEIRWRLARELTGFGVWNVVGDLSEMIRKSSDPIILNKFGTAVDVTSFYLGSIPSGMIQATVSQAKSPVMPALTAMHATDREDRLQNAYLRGGRFALWALLFPIVPLIVFSQEVIRLYVGDPYMPAATVMALLLGLFPFVHGHAMFPNIAVAKAEMRSLALRALAVQVLNLLLTLYLVGVMRMGAVGSALGTFISMTVIWPLLNWRFALRMVNLNYRRWLRETVWPGLLPALPAAVVLLAMKWLVQPSSWLVLGLCTAAGLACYGAVLVGFCLRPADKADLRRGMATIASMLGMKRGDRSQ